jgi:hypothetical protein
MTMPGAPGSAPRSPALTWASFFVYGPTFAESVARAVLYPFAGVSS